MVEIVKETATAMDDEHSIPNMVDLTIARIRKGLESREFACADLCEAYLARIAEVNDKLHAVIQTNPDAMAIAAARDRDYESNGHDQPRGSLHGVPILVKDVFNVDSKLTASAGSIVLSGTYSVISTAVDKLNVQGAITFGTTNLSEFANLRGELCPDGWSPLGGQCYGNNGSITSPAAQAACVGFKPTVGLISRKGVISFDKYQDCPGHITRTVEDSAWLLSVLAGKNKVPAPSLGLLLSTPKGLDPEDPITYSIPRNLNFDLPAACASSTLVGARFAVPRVSNRDNVHDPQILASLDLTLALLRSYGATIIDNVEYPSWTPDFSRQTLPFVWGQLKESFDTYISSLRSNPSSLQSLSDVWTSMQSLSAERVSEYGGSRFLKALASPKMDFEKVLASRAAKGSEITQILEINSCDAIPVPEEGRNPADLGQPPVVCLLMGFYSSTTGTQEVDEYGLKTKGPNIPYAPNSAMLNLEWKVVHPILRDNDKPHLFPKTELRDVVKRRQKVEGASSSPHT